MQYGFTPSNLEFSLLSSFVLARGKFPVMGEWGSGGAIVQLPYIDRMREVSSNFFSFLEREIDLANGPGLIGRFTYRKVQTEVG